MLKKMRTEETILLCVGVRAQSVEKSSFDCFDCLIMAGLKCVRIPSSGWILACVLVLLFQHKESPSFFSDFMLLPLHGIQWKM